MVTPHCTGEVVPIQGIYKGYSFSDIWKPGSLCVQDRLLDQPLLPLLLARL